MNSGQTRVRLVQAGAVLMAVALIAGCGSAYRSVITPITSTGPAAQPQSLAVVVSSPSPASAGIATIIDYAGDSVMATQPIGVGPVAFTLTANGSSAYTINSDQTMTVFPVSTMLQEKQVNYSTLPAGAQPVSLFYLSSGLWAADLTGNLVDVFGGTGGSAQAFELSVPVAATPVMVIGPGSGGQRNFVLSQVVDSNGVDCNNSPASVAEAGYVTPIEVNPPTADPAIPVGKCPVYAVQTTDFRRLFVINRGGDTISVINTQDITADGCTPFQNQDGHWITCHATLPLSTTAGLAQDSNNDVPTISGPVYAEYNAATQQLVVANYDGSTISIIDVSMDEYGNDYNTYANNNCTINGISAYANCGAITGGFGTTYTVPVGHNPASVTVLYDGSRAYTANQTDGTVSIVNLSSHTIEKAALPVMGHPRTVVSTENSEYGKVYVASPDSNYLTIISTTTDLVDTTVLIQGNLVDVRVSTQNGAAGINSNPTTRKPGFGQPCNLPGTTASATLTACTAMP
jgi:DNA-binding beta-propeller fold protein YncE